jgi:hypothetical protein
MTEGSLRPHTDNNTASTNRPPHNFYTLASHNAKPRVLRLAHVSCRQNVNIKYGDVEAVRVDRAYCGLEPGR